MRRVTAGIASVVVVFASAAHAQPARDTHANGMWWTLPWVDTQTAMQFLPDTETKCKGTGPSITRPYVLWYQAVAPYLHGQKAPAWEPLLWVQFYHHFRCHTIVLKDGSSFNWILHPVSKMKFVASATT